MGFLRKLVLLVTSIGGLTCLPCGGKWYTEHYDDGTSQSGCYTQDCSNYIGD